MGTKFVVKKKMSSPELARQIEPAVGSLMQAIARRMQRLVPKRSFNLNDTIAADTHIEGSTVIGEAGAGGNGEAPYWAAVEYGTSRQAAQPYIKPALLQSKSSDLGGAR
jgi:HK97 gp10 family phage protein